MEKSKIVLPKEYTEPKSANIDKNLSMIIFGPPKVGKTTFASQFPDSLLIEAEKGGADYVRSRKVEINSLQELREIHKLLQNDKQFKTVIIDTLDKVVSWIEEEICKELNISNILVSPKSERIGSQWAEYKERVLGFIESMLILDKLVIFLSHTKKAELDNNGNILNAKTINLYGQTATQVMSRINNIGYMFAKELPGNIVERYISFAPGIQVEAGSRHPNLSGKIIKIPLENGYNSFANCFKETKK